MPRFVITTRAVRRGAFSSEPGGSQYLVVDEGRAPRPDDARSFTRWWAALRTAATWGTDERVPSRERGDLLVLVHGYNTSQAQALEAHDAVAGGLSAMGWRGAVVSFDWPSAGMALNYVEDRHDAKRVAMQLVRDGIARLATLQEPGCAINVHVLAHSTGAYVVREAFDDADDARLENMGWMTSQVAFIGADVSTGSLRAGDSSSASLYRHCARLTNYANRGDSVLKLSNVKRMGVAPRAGRIGLPADAPPHAVHVDCTGYFRALADDPAVRAADQAGGAEPSVHSWHFGNRVFMRDLFETLKGDLDRGLIPTRRATPDGRWELVRG